MKNLLVIFTLFFFSNSYSQDLIKANNIVYLDVGVILAQNSIAIGMGLNYERMLSDNFSIRGGVNVGFFGSHVIGDKISGTGLGFPISINYMTKGKNKFEAGLGGGPMINLSNDNSVSFVPVIKVGYRYQPDENGMMFKFGLELPSNMYISILGAGYKFK